MLRVAERHLVRPRGAIEEVEERGVPEPRCQVAHDDDVLPAQALARRAGRQLRIPAPRRSGALPRLGLGLLPALAWLILPWRPFWQASHQVIVELPNIGVIDALI